MGRTLIGTVVSDKNDKTIIVSVETRKTHPIYKKQYTETKRFAAHDDKSEAAVGDRVAITEVRPLSATKHFQLDKIVSKAGIEHVEPETTSEETPVVSRKSAKQSNTGDEV